MRTADALDQFWADDPGTIRAFLKVQPHYEKLAEEVAYVLEKNVQTSDIEYSAVTFRAKTVDRFCEKLTRKTYKDPLTEITDIAGVRVVFLYPKDRPQLETIIEKEFHVVEKVDKVDDEQSDRFGYGALHYLVKLNKNASGARYDDLKGLVCEIQVRTILQDAWAIVAHHLSYKQESDVPKQLRRKLNALSGQFMLTDNLFDQLRDEQLRYKDTLRTQISEREADFLKNTINADNLVEFLNWRLPDREPPTVRGAGVLRLLLKENGYTTLSALDTLWRRTHEAVKAYETKYPIVDPKTGGPTRRSQMGAIAIALYIIDGKTYPYRGKQLEDRTKEFRHLVKD